MLARSSLMKGAGVLGIALGRFLRSADGGKPPEMTGLIDADRALVSDQHSTGATSFSHPADADRFARPFAVDEASPSVLSVDDGHSDPNAEPDTARPGS